MQEEIGAIQRQIAKMFAYSHKFEAANVTGGENGSQISTKSGYQENSLSNLGTSSSDRPSHGQSRIVLAGRGPNNLPVDLGPSPWISG